MALALTAEQEAVVERSVREGRYASAHDVLDAALQALDQEAFLPEKERSRLAELRAKSLFELMQDSPLYGSDIEFDRDRSQIRELDL